MDGLQRGSAAIVGVAESDLGAVASDMSAIDLMAQGILLIEAARQLRHECGARQVADCETAIAHGNGGVLSSQSTVILGTAATV
jgi:hypothetical protein